MGSYAYLTAGIITARQAELMKNEYGTTGKGFEFDGKQTAVSSLPCCVHFLLSTKYRY